MKKTINYLLSGVIAAAVLTFGGCKKKDTTLPAIGGFNSSSDIEPLNLVAYWPFSGSFTETVAGLTATPSSTAPTFVNGIKGQAYQGGGDTYINFAPGTIGSVASLTVSIWFDQTTVGGPINNTTANYIAGQGPQGMLFMYNAATWESIQIDNEPYTPASGDSLRIHAGFSTNTSALTGAYAGAQEGLIAEGFVQNATSKWTQLVMTYDATSSNYTLYQNGVAIGVSTAWSSAKTSAGSVQLLTGGAPVVAGGTQPVGSLILNSPTGLIIGGFPQVLDNTNATYSPNSPQPWTGNFQGALDEIRIYKVALSASEVGSLYQLELAGR
jgi:hypothetical protein